VSANYLPRKSNIPEVLSVNVAQAEGRLNLAAQYTSTSTAACSADFCGLIWNGIQCYDKALSFDAQNANTWYSKASLEDSLKRKRVAQVSYRKFLEVATPEQQAMITWAQRRVRELEQESL
jgi:hypothetical protein